MSSKATVRFSKRTLLHALFIYLNIKGKGKVHPCTRQLGSVQAVRPVQGVDIQLYSFLTTALEGVKCRRQAQDALYPGKDPVSIVVGGPVSSVGKATD